MSDEPKTDKLDGKPWRLWATIVVVLPVLYVLSIGPVVGLTPHLPTGFAQDVKTAGYRPLLWLAQYRLPGEALASYISLFGVDAIYAGDDSGVVLLIGDTI